MINELWQDVRYGIRGLRHAPGFTAVAALTLALGIGANSAIFSFVDGVLLKPIAFPEPERILQIWEKPPGGGFNVVSALNSSIGNRRARRSSQWPRALVGQRR